MNLDRYAYSINRSFLDYMFDSVGPNGTIHKVARFSKIDYNIFNFGFGDLNTDTGEITDIVISNNKDSERILKTLAAIIIEFTNKFKDVFIFCKGTTVARNRLYQINLHKYWSEIQPLFLVWGLYNNEWMTFRKGVNYEAFLGFRKSFLS